MIIVNNIAMPLKNMLPSNATMPMIRIEPMKKRQSMIKGFNIWMWPGERT